MFNNLSSLIIDGKSVSSLSIDGTIVWQASTNPIAYKFLRTVDNKFFTTINGRRFVVEVEESDR